MALPGAGWQQEQLLLPGHRDMMDVPITEGHRPWLLHLGRAQGQGRAAEQPETALLRHPAEKDAYGNNYFGNDSPLSCLKP